MEWVRWFAQLDRESLPLAGGKGANLGETSRAGLPVPPGFVLLTPAYRAFVAEAGVQESIVRLAVTAAPDEATAAIRALFESAPIPVPVAEAVRQAYAELGGGPVAVRSSATAEDLPGASFAGQQETYLNVIGEDAVLAAVRRCWSSLWTARAISYRVRQEIDPGSVALAVVIQQQVDAEVAGVLFTANPVTGRRTEMVVDGAWGLGEAVVSGRVTPDQWVAVGATGAVLQERLACKELMTVRADGEPVPGVGGTLERPVPAELRNRPCLDAAGVAALVAMGRQVAAHYGAPQDLEWALAGGRFYLLQARPITTLFPLPSPEPPPGAGLRVYFCANTLQGLVEPLTPMAIEIFGLVAFGGGRLMGYRLPEDERPPVIKEAAMRMYVDVTTGLRHPRLRQVVMALPRILDQPASRALTALLERERELDPVPGPMPLRLRPFLALQMFVRFVHVAIAPSSARRRVLAFLDAYLHRLKHEAAGLRDVGERVAFVRDRTAGVLLPVSRLGALMLPAVGLRFVVEGKLKQWLGDAAGLQPVLRSLPYNPTTEMDLALWRVSRRLKAEGAEPAAKHPAVAEFLERYGHRAVREIDIGMPRWDEEPEHVLNALRGYLDQSEAADPEAHFASGAREAEAAVQALVQRVRREKGLIRAGVTRFLLRRVRDLAGLRERPKFFMVQYLALQRRVLLGAGAELAAAGRLEWADDVFFLTLRELEGTTELKPLVAARREEHRRELGRRSIPRLMTSEGEALYGAPLTADAAGALVGTPASAGVYEGRVRVVHDPTGARLEPGEVLVAPGTDPAWTPLFLTAGALVMEIGGVMSHGSVVAREYGIPAVVGVTGATERLTTGQRVRVDGESGQVTLLE
jgi:rifampicin phosphotransferase